MMDYLEITEQEFSLSRVDRINLKEKVILRGTPDLVRVYHSRGIVAVLERKFGYKQVQPADANLQLRCYLAMVARTYPANNYYGCLVQPRISSKPQIVQYTLDEIFQAEDEIFRIYDACYAEDPPRHASNEACEHCSAKALCPEFAQWTSAVVKSQHLPVASWSDEQMDIFLSRRGILEKFLKDTLEQIKQIKLANPERIPQWRLKEGASVRTVENLVQAYGALQQHMSAQQFSDACEIHLGDIEKLIWQNHQDNQALGRLTQKAAKALVTEALGDLVKFKKNKPSLVRDE